MVPSWPRSSPGICVSLAIEELSADLTAHVVGRRLDDDLAALLRFEGGARGVLKASQIAAGDVRIHTVEAVGTGHRIHEQRCLAEKLSGRSWTHSMQPDEEEFTVESVARSAPWLKKDGR